MSDLASDPRWRRFNDAGFRCGCCGQSFGGCFSWLTNSLPGIPTSESVPCDLVIGELTQRPKLFAHEDAGAVRDAQSQGISFDDLLDIYAASGQDIRPHLMDA